MNDAVAESKPIDISESTPSTSRVLRRLRAGVMTLIVALCFWGGYRGVTGWLVDREDERAPRNSVTGFMLGAEPRDLGPEDATKAALFVHGYAGCGNNFRDVPDRLAEEGWRVRVLLLPGHGTSPRDLEHISADTLIDTVVAEAETLREEHGKVILVGHSMGSALSTIAASQTKVDGLVLGGAYFGVTHRWYYGLRPETWTVIGSRLVRWVYKGDLFLQVDDRSVKDDIICYTWLPTQSGVMLNDLGRRVRAPEVLNNVNCPVLMLHSHGDVAASPEAAERAFEGMAATDKELVWLPNSNHHIYWDYDRDQVEREIAKFAVSVSGQPK
ncbi:MAG: carboxylesterase [Candidatus Hydrogenedentota bacterium]